MIYILNIETATEVCSVSVSADNQNLFERVNYDGPSHSTLLGLFVNDAMSYIKSQSIALDAIAVSCGPGSYTGLRIGVSMAKGLCYGLSIPLIAIPTLKLMAYSASKTLGDNKALLCPMIDARRMEVYDALYSVSLDEIRKVEADIIDEGSFQDYLSSQKIFFFGNGADKCKKSIVSDNAVFLENIFPIAMDMHALSLVAFQNQDFVDVAYYEPFYLKEFVATKPKNKVLPSF